MFKSAKGWKIDITQVDNDKFNITITRANGSKITFIRDSDGCQFVDDVIDLEKYYNTYTTITYLIDGVKNEAECDSRIYNFIDID